MLSRLKAFCSLTFDNTFVIRDVKLIDGNDERGIDVAFKDGRTERIVAEALANARVREVETT